MVMSTIWFIIHIIERNVCALFSLSLSPVWFHQECYSHCNAWKIYVRFILFEVSSNEWNEMNERTTKPSVVCTWCVCCAEMWCTFIWAKPNRTEPRTVWLFSFIRSHLNGYICISIECERQSWIDDSGKATHLHLIFCTCC